MIINTTQITERILEDLQRWRSQLMKQRRYIDEKINEIDRILEEHGGEQ